MDTKEVVHLALQIQKLAAEQSFGNILSLLGDLDKSHLTAEQLEATNVVKVLYRLLRTCSDHSVKETVKRLLSRWKREYGDERRGGKNAAVCDVFADAGARSLAQEDGDDGPVQAENRGKGGSEREARCAVQCATSSASSDPVRTKCVQLLLSALHPEPPNQDYVAQLAEDIERHIHELHAANQLKYKTCVRSKVANLRNAKHGHLRQGLLSGSLPPDVFAGMSAEEMASPELRQLRKEYSSRGVSERQLPQGPAGTQTRKIRCKRCEGSDCRVTQVSRGALFLPAWVRRGGPDEDAMTFVTCSGCGQQWYHSGWNCL